MDYDKLVERLSRYSEPVIAYKLDGDFAEAVIEAKRELESIKHGQCTGCSVPDTTAEMIRDLNDAPKLRAENEQLRADLARVTAERDAAVKVIERVRSCKDCGHYTGEWTPPCKECQDSEEHHPYFKWRGQKED